MGGGGRWRSGRIIQTMFKSLDVSKQLTQEVRIWEEMKERMLSSSQHGGDRTPRGDNQRNNVQSTYNAL